MVAQIIIGASIFWKKIQETLQIMLRFLCSSEFA